jgi:hypothetical protein
MSITRTLCLSVVITAGAFGCHRADRDRDRNQPQPGSPRVVEGADDSPEARAPTPAIPGADRPATNPDPATPTVNPTPSTAPGTQESTDTYNARAGNSANGGAVAPDTAGAGTMGQVRNDDPTPMANGPGSGSGKGSGKGSGSGTGSGSAK